jgi:hypothetical protein
MRQLLERIENKGLFLWGPNQVKKYIEDIIVVGPDYNKSYDSLKDAQREANILAKKNMGSEYFVYGILDNGKSKHQFNVYKWEKLNPGQAKIMKEKPYMFR